jgi:hypothetical protein
VPAFEKELQGCWWPSQHLPFILTIVRNWQCMSSLLHSGYYLVSNYMNYLSIAIDAQTLRGKCLSVSI